MTRRFVSFDSGSLFKRPPWLLLCVSRCAAAVTCSTCCCTFRQQINNRDADEETGILIMAVVSDQHADVQGEVRVRHRQPWKVPNHLANSPELP